MAAWGPYVVTPAFAGIVGEHQLSSSFKGAAAAADKIVPALPQPLVVLGSCNWQQPLPFTYASYASLAWTGGAPPPERSVAVAGYVAPHEGMPTPPARDLRPAAPPPRPGEAQQSASDRRRGRSARWAVHASAPTFPKRAAPKYAGMVEFNVEDFAFVLQPDDVLKESSGARQPLRNHPEPGRSPSSSNSSAAHGGGSSDYEGQQLGPRSRGQAPSAKQSPRSRGGGAAKSVQPGGHGMAEPRGRAAQGRGAVRGRPAPGGTAPWQGREQPAQRGAREQDLLCDDGPPAKWHTSTLNAGYVSGDGHVFSKAHPGPHKKISNNATLASLCILFEANIRSGGVHRYRYSILEGSVGNADGVGFIFDTKVRRTNIQKVHSIFLNRHGQICTRCCEHITKTTHYLPRLALGSRISLTIDLEHALARFEMDDADGNHSETKNISFESLLREAAQRDANFMAHKPTSGFFCAIVTDNIKVSLY